MHEDFSFLTAHRGGGELTCQQYLLLTVLGLGQHWAHAHDPEHHTMFVEEFNQGVVLGVDAKVDGGLHAGHQTLVAFDTPLTEVEKLVKGSYWGNFDFH